MCRGRRRCGTNAKANRRGSPQGVQAMSATERWNREVETECKAGFALDAAKSRVDRRIPGLRQAYLAEFHRAGNPLVSARYAQEAADCGYRAQ